MRRRRLIEAAAAVTVAGPFASAPARASVRDEGAKGSRSVVWKPIAPTAPGVPALIGHTDTVPDIVGRLGSPIDLAIFTEGNHFPALFGGEIIEPFRIWARAQTQYAALATSNIVVVTLPQPMIVAMLLTSAISLGNLTIEVSRASGFYPDIVMAGAAPLGQLHKASIIGNEARVFARNCGLAFLAAAGNPLAIDKIGDIARPEIRVVMASTSEPGARRQYIAALGALIGEEATRLVLSRETVSFPGRLGIQHRDVLQAIAGGYADVGIIFHHLARYYASVYPELCTIVTVPGAERYSSTIAIASAADPLRAQAAQAFSEFFLSVAREVYPRYGFAMISEEEFAAPVALD